MWVRHPWVEGLLGLLRRGLGPGRLARLKSHGFPDSLLEAGQFFLADQTTPRLNSMLQSTQELRAWLRADPLRREQSVTQRVGCLLYLCLESRPQPATVLELGTGFGASASYLASSGRCRRLLSLDMSAQRQQLARPWLARFPQVELLQGRFEQLLGQIEGRFDVVLVDGGKDQEVQRSLSRLVLPRLQPEALIVFDDIRWSRRCWDCWLELRQQRGFTDLLDFGRVGVALWQDGWERSPRLWSLTYPWDRLWGWWRMSTDLHPPGHRALRAFMRR